MRPPYGRLLECKRLKLRFLKMYVLCYKCHMQVVQVHLQPFWCSSLLKCVSQLEIAKKNSIKTHILRVQGHSRSSTLTHKKIVTSASYDEQHVPICNRFHAMQDNCSKIPTF